jgi:hypothetical protein
MARNWRVSINPSITSIMNGAANRGVALAAEHILGVSVENTPIEEGTLRRSTTVSTDPATFTAAVSVDTPYAVVVHEDMQARHKTGAAKFLERAMNSEVQVAAEIIRKTIAGDL